MFVIGIDLAGPSNLKDTALACFKGKQGGLQLTQFQSEIGDQAIFDLVNQLDPLKDIVIGLDAPLSYNLGGGDRPGDRKLRRKIIQAGMPSGSVMPPTMTRMVYLTLRGITLANALKNINSNRIKVVEVHPTAAMVLRGAPPEQVTQLKSSALAQQALLDWLGQKGLEDLSVLQGSGDHMLAACASAYAAWQWHERKSVWQEPARQPFHPYDFAC
jgi:predicted nuclease with RNAse H fold